MTQAILLGAGQSSRLVPLIGRQPKWMLEVAGQSIAQHLVNALHSCNVTDVLLVRGAYGGTVLTPSVAYRDVLKTKNMLETLYRVRSAVRDDLIVAYCDLIIEPRLISAVANSSASAGVAVDLQWFDLFNLRADDPLTIAESCTLSKHGFKDIGQPLKRGQVPEAQYIGLMRFTRSRFEQLMDLYSVLAATHAGQPWRNAKTFESAYFTDFLQEAIERGFELTPITVNGGWLEFDTPKDFHLACDLAVRPRPEIIDFAALPSRPSVLSAGGIAIRERGVSREVLLVGSGDSGSWRIPKGMLEQGESIAAAACREVFEETGVPVQIEHFVGSDDWTYPFNGREWWERCYFHRLTPLANTAPQPDSEHTAASWVPVSDALPGMLYENERRRIAAALDSFARTMQHSK